MSDQTAVLSGYTVHQTFTNTAAGLFEVYGADYKDNAQYIFSRLLGRGFTANAAAAIIGNVSRESHCNPGLCEMGFPVLESGYGLIQWTPASVITQYLEARGVSDPATDFPRVLSAQVTALAVEVETESLPGYGVVWIPTTDFPLSGEAFKASGESVAYLTEAYMRERERPGVPALEERVEAAEWALTNLAQTPIEPITSKIISVIAQQKRRRNNYGNPGYVRAW